MNAKKYSLLATSIILGLATSLYSQKKESAAEKIVAGQYGFETDTESAGWVAQGGNLQHSGKHFKDGRQSLCWTWERNGSLQVANLQGLKKAAEPYPGGIPEIYEPSFYPKGRFGGLKIWLYQEKADSGQVVFQFGSNPSAARDAPKYRFSVNLNFTGWRTVWVCFEEDAKVAGYKGSDELSSMFAYPVNVSNRQNRLYIDHLTLLNFVSNKRNSDLQFENHKRNLRSADGYEILTPYQKFASAVFKAPYNQQQLDNDSREITSRLEYLILGDPARGDNSRDKTLDKVMAGKLQTAKNLFTALNIQRDHDIVNGIPLFAIRDEHPAKNGKVFDNVAEDLLFPLALDYRLSGSQQSGKQVLDALDYFMDQGWAGGSAMGTVDHVIRLTPIATTIFLMRKELKATGRMKPLVDMLIWHTRMGALLELDATRGENTDKVRGGALVKLITILLMDNTDQKQELMDDFIDYMRFVARFAPGYSDTFKPDYSLYHHRGPYLSAYGSNTLNTMALIHWLMKGTSFEMGQDATKNITAALQTQASIAYGVQVHYGVSGRFPLNNSAIDGNCLPAFAYMSLSGDSVYNPELAALFTYIYKIAGKEPVGKMLTPGLSYSGSYGTMDLLERLQRQMRGLEQPPKDGVTVMPYSALMAYRLDTAFATVKGYNKYVWDFESGKGENNLGRYLSHGMLIAANGNPAGGLDGLGLDINGGFDWSMLPGATTKQLPADKVMYVPKADKKYVEGKHRNFSNSIMASGLHQGKTGTFALDLRDDVFPDSNRILFDSSFRARKSWFFINNEIICLGSGIHNDDKRYPTVTTLFQYHTDTKRPNYYNHQIITATGPAGKSADGGVFTDQNGLHYIIPKGQRLRWSRTEQSSYHWKAKKYTPVTSTYTKAWLDHQAAPKSEGYEYEILLQAKDPQHYLDVKSYEILQKDATAHSIHHYGAGIDAYAVFEGGKDLHGGILLRSDAPVLVQIKQSNGQILLTIADPDLKQAVWNHNMSHMPDSITNAWAAGQIITITLKGEWYAAQHADKLISIETKGGNSAISVFCKDGQSIDIALQQRKFASNDEQ